MLTTPKTMCVKPSSRSVTGFGLRAQRREREADEHRHEDHAQDAASRKRADHGVRNDVQEEVGDGLRLGLTGIASHRARIARRRSRVEPGARLRERAHHQADEQRDAGEDFKVEERLAADAADLLDASMPAMPAATVQKMTSEITIVMRRMKPSPSGRIACAVSGDTYPRTIASATLTSTCPHRVR